MKKQAIRGLLALTGFVVSTITTAWITGQPLTGLVKLKGLYQTFIRSSVPAWAFALAFLVALWGIYYALTHLPNRKPKGTVHFVPDAHNCGWSKKTETEMNVRIGGTFTYDEPSELIILKAYLKGTRPTTDMMVQILALGAQRPTTTPEFWLRGGLAQRAFIHLHLKPVLGTPGQPLRRALILLDKFNREFPVGPIEFPYSGRADGAT